MIEFHISSVLYSSLMIKWFKKTQNDVSETVVAVKETIRIPEEEIDSSKISVYSRFKRGLSKTRRQLGDGVGRLLLGKKTLDADLLLQLETLLLSADMGMATTQKVLSHLSEELARKQLSDGDAVFAALRERLQSMLAVHSQPLQTEVAARPYVILTVGINGAGKTTTIGKLARHFQQQGKKVMLAAGDTFRAAAVEQLQIWGERNQIPVIAQQTGADSASVLYDALQAARARGIDILIADTAGRLHTQGHLMEELKKIKRVIQKLDPQAPHETMLVLDAGTGQNALNQAQEFHKAIGLTGITMTKLDGTAKGGILFAIAEELGLPFRYLGIGEGIEDLRPFDAEQFVGALFNND